MKQGLSRLGDWRIPLIFAVPVVLWAAVLYLAFQPSLGTKVAATTDGGTITEHTTPLPTFIPTPYPTVAPTAAPIFVPPLPCSTGVTAMTVTPTVAKGQVTLRATDQQGRLVVCAWFSQRGGNYGILGGTDTTGTLSAPLASMPRNTHISEIATLGAVSTTVDFFVEH